MSEFHIPEDFWGSCSDCGEPMSVADVADWWTVRQGDLIVYRGRCRDCVAALAPGGES